MTAGTADNKRKRITRSSSRLAAKEEAKKQQLGANKTIAKAPPKKKQKKKPKSDIKPKPTSSSSSSSATTNTEISTNEKVTKSTYPIVGAHGFQPDCIPTDDRDHNALYDSDTHFKFISWNVNGIAACIEKSDTLIQLITTEKPDVLCIQETKKIQSVLS